MRVGPIGFYFDEDDEILKEAKASSEVTHNHPHGIDGAQAIALAIHHAKIGDSKEQIKKIVFAVTGYYDLNKTVDDYRKNYKFDTSCKVTVPQALTAFFESDSFEDCIRKAVLMGGDTDTLACIAGSVAEAYYKIIPNNISMKALEKLPVEFSIIINRFYREVLEGNI